MLATLLMLSICIEAGDLVNRFLSINGLKLPGFLTAMVIGIIISNAADLLSKELHKPTIAATGELSLQLFLGMSLMSMQLWILANAATAILIAVVLQALLITLVAIFFVFRLTG
ncbi:MAG: sodium/glutamate symporter, partial [Gammaproteobacteria bacterium]|nr:sodium/glutamate symporter [Gammaproteobacteria bacterium]